MISVQIVHTDESVAELGGFWFTEVPQVGHRVWVVIEDGDGGGGELRDGERRLVTVTEVTWDCNEDEACPTYGPTLMVEDTERREEDTEYDPDCKHPWIVEGFCRKCGMDTDALGLEDRKEIPTTPEDAIRAVEDGALSNMSGVNPE